MRMYHWYGKSVILNPPVKNLGRGAYGLTHRMRPPDKSGCPAPQALRLRPQGDKQAKAGRCAHSFSFSRVPVAIDVDDSRARPPQAERFRGKRQRKVLPHYSGHIPSERFL